MLTVSAPGSLMIAGEHAVIEGEKALVMAIDHRLTVKIKETKDNTISIQSLLGTRHYTLPIENTNCKDWQDRILYHFKNHIDHGLDIEIESSIDSELGLGSSAALISALFYALKLVSQQAMSSYHHHWQECLAFLRQYHPLASGSDLAASHFGGILELDPKHASIHSIRTNARWFIAYTGYKTKTHEVIQQVRQHYDPRLFDQIGTTTTQLKAALVESDLSTAGELMNKLYQYQQALHTSCRHSDRLWDLMQAHCFGAKLSGSGLGDCMIGLLKTSNIPDQLGPYSTIHCRPDQQGLLCHD